jgi:hypothetical protein
MKTYGGVDVYIHVFLTSVLFGGEWSDSCPGRFTPGERAPVTHWIWSWMGPIADLGDMEKWKFLRPPGLQLDLLVVQPVASRYTDCAIPALGLPYRLSIISTAVYCCYLMLLFVITCQHNNDSTVESYPLKTAGIWICRLKYKSSKANFPRTWVWTYDPWRQTIWHNGVSNILINAYIRARVCAAVYACPEFERHKRNILKQSYK